MAECCASKASVLSFSKVIAEELGVRYDGHILVLRPHGDQLPPSPTHRHIAGLLWMPTRRNHRVWKLKKVFRLVATALSNPSVRHRGASCHSG